MKEFQISEPKMKDTLEVPSEKYAYLSEGSGQPLLCLHGLVGGISSWVKMAQLFADQYHVIVPHLPVTQGEEQYTTTEGLTNYVAEFAKHHGFENLRIAGSSLGGHIALRYALRYPKNVKSIVLLGSSGLYEKAPLPSLRSLSDARDPVQVSESLFFNPKAPSPFVGNTLYEWVHYLSAKINITEIWRSIKIGQSARDDKLHTVLPLIKTPVGIIWGLNDVITPPHTAYNFYQLLPNATLYWIDKCGHKSVFECPYESHKVMDAFLSDYS